MKVHFKHSFLNKLLYLFIGAFITGVFTYFFNIRLLEQKNIYEKRAEKQTIILDLSQQLNQRIYNAEVFFWDIYYDARKETIMDSWDRYKKITISWNEKLQNNYVLLNILFPTPQYTIDKYSDILKSNLSFRDFLKDEIQLDLISVHNRLIDLKKIINKNDKIDTQNLGDFKNDIEKLHIKITNYIDTLAKAVTEK